MNNESDSSNREENKRSPQVRSECVPPAATATYINSRRTKIPERSAIPADERLSEPGPLLLDLFGVIRSY